MLVLDIRNVTFVGHELLRSDVIHLDRRLLVALGDLKQMQRIGSPEAALLATSTSIVPDA